MEASLCFGFRNSEWPSLKRRMEAGDEDAWAHAIGVFKRRVEERYLSSIDALCAADTAPDRSADELTEQHCIPGFAIIALCCLLIDTIQGFREKPAVANPQAEPCRFPSGPCLKPPSGTAQQFRVFLRRPAFGDTFKDESVATAFVNGVRNGILHEAETRKWVIWRSEPAGRIVSEEQDGFALNRELFYRAVRNEFECYLEELGQTANVALRQRFKKKMNDIFKAT